MIDITDLPNPAGGRCVICDTWVVKRAGWRVRAPGSWAGVACDGHPNPAAPRRHPSAGARPVHVDRREGLVERAERIAALARERDRTGRLPI